MIGSQKAGGIARFGDHERSFDARLGEALGLSLDPNKWLYQQPKTFEESIDQAMEIAHIVRDPSNGVDPESPMVFVFDSLAWMVPKSKWYVKPGEDERQHRPRSRDSSGFPRFLAVVRGTEHDGHLPQPGAHQTGRDAWRPHHHTGRIGDGVRSVHADQARALRHV
jgi:hypothetical protein